MRLHAQFHAVLAPQPWLYRTVHNLAVDHQRRASKIVLVGKREEDDACPLNDATDSQPLPDERSTRRLAQILLVQLGGTSSVGNSYTKSLGSGPVGNTSPSGVRTTVVDPYPRGPSRGRSGG